MTPLFAVFGGVDPWIFTFSFITVVVTIGMGFWSARRSKTAADFFVAGRSVSVGWNASAISGEYLSAASFMGIAGMVMSSGYDALWYPVCYACGYLFLLLFVAAPLRRFGAYTIPDFAEGRFNSRPLRSLSVAFVLLIGVFYMLPQMKGAGLTVQTIAGLPYWVGVVTVGGVMALNVALGGVGLFYFFPSLLGLIGRVHAPELYAEGRTDALLLELPGRLGDPIGGEVLRAVVAAGAFAAFASTTSGLLVAVAGALAHDLYARTLRPGAGQQERQAAFRVAALVAGTIAVAGGLGVERFHIN